MWSDLGVWQMRLAVLFGSFWSWWLSRLEQPTSKVAVVCRFWTGQKHKSMSCEHYCDNNVLWGLYAVNCVIHNYNSVVVWLQGDICNDVDVITMISFWRYNVTILFLAREEKTDWRPAYHVFAKGGQAACGCLLCHWRPVLSASHCLVDRGRLSIPYTQLYRPREKRCAVRRSQAQWPQRVTVKT